MRPDLNYGDVMYDQPGNDSFSTKTETVQYNVSFVITGAITGTFKDISYQELGLELLKVKAHVLFLQTN